jgi:acetyl esterase/lipase
MLLSAIVAASLACLGTPAATAEADQAVTTEESTYPTVHGAEPMTVYYPADRSARNKAPAVVMVHGGAWIRGSRALLDSDARQAAAAGFVVFNIEYDLSAPRFPREPQDVDAAIGYIHAHPDRYGIDPGRIGGLGTSAGANLIMMAATASHAPLKAVVGWSGPYDLRIQGTAKDAAEATAIAVGYLGCVPGLPACAAVAADASPLTHVSAGDPPTLLFNSANELVDVGQMTRFADKLRSVGTPAETRILPGTRHAEQYAADAIGPTLSFLQRTV